MKRNNYSFRSCILTAILMLIVTSLFSQTQAEWSLKSGVTESPIGVIKDVTVSGYSGASSSNQLYENENGWIEYKAIQTNKERVFGFSKYSASYRYDSVYFGYKLSSTGDLYSVEKTTNTSLGKFSTNDLFRIERKGDTVYYSRNTSIVRKTKVTSKPLFWINACFGDTGAMFEYVQCSFVPSTVDSIFPDKDAMVSSYPADTATNFGASVGWFVAYGTASGIWHKKRAMMEIPTTNIPMGATIGSATLYIYNYPPYAHSLNTNAALLSVITSPWNESTVKWNTQPTYDSTKGKVRIPAATSTSQNYSLNIKTVLQDWVNEIFPNYGFLGKQVIETGTTQRNLYFCSSDYTTASKRPKVLLTYKVSYQYNSAQKKLDGSFYPTYKKRFAFAYNEEYNVPVNKRLCYNIYDSTRTLKAGVDKSGIPQVTNSPVLYVKYGENQYLMNLANLSLVDKSYYILEIINDKDEKQYIRFRYYNN